MINVQNISSKLASLPDQALKQYAEMHKEDPYVFSLALSESNRRKQLRMQTQQPEPQPKVVDKELADMDMRKALPEDLGIARIPVDMNMAGGGIVAFDDGGYVPRYKDQGAVKTSVADLRQAIIDEANAQGVDPAIALQIAGSESNMNPSAIPVDPKTGNLRSSAKGLFGVIDDTFKRMGGDPEKRLDPLENIRIGVKSLAYTQDSLSKQLGRQPDASEIYTGHFLGAETGGKLLQADPNMSVQQFLTKTDPKNANNIIKSNPEVLSGKKVGDVLDWTQKKMAPVLTAMVPANEAVAQTTQAPAKESSWRDFLPSFGGDKVSDQSLSDLVTGKPKPPPQAGPSATLSGVGKALMTKEGVKRAGIGALEDSAIGVAGMPSDLGRGMSSSSVPVLRGLGTAADYLKSQFAPNAASDVGTTPYLKRKLTEADLRPQDSPDPNLRAIQSGGELAGYFVNPINALRSGAGKIGNVIREGRAELKSMGLQDIADKKAAVAAAAKAQADAAAKSSTPLRLTDEISPVAPGVTPATGPSLGAKAELDKMEAAKKARIAAGFEQDAATAKAMAEAKAAETVNAPPKAIPGKPAGVSQQVWNEANAAKAPPKGATSPTRAASVVASPGQVLARNTGKENFPSVSMGDGSEEDAARETQGLSNRYPAPSEPPPPIDYDEGVGRRDAGYGTDKQIVAAAKEALPKSEDTDGWSKNDWLQFGLGMMAGQSPHALTNIGAAGLGVIASKAEIQKQKNTLANYKAVHGASAVQIAERLMADDPSLSFEDALAKGNELTGGSTKEALAATKANAVAATNLKNFEAAKEKLDARYSIYMNGTGPTAQAAQKRYENELQKLYAIHSIPVNTASPAAVIPGAKIVGTRQSP